jgi:hypothetical protein
MRTVVDTSVGSRTTEYLLAEHERLADLMAGELETYATPGEPTRSGKEAAKRAEVIYRRLIDVHEELERREVELPAVGELDALKTRWRRHYQ